MLRHSILRLSPLHIACWVADVTEENKNNSYLSVCVCMCFSLFVLISGMAELLFMKFSTFTKIEEVYHRILAGSGFTWASHQERMLYVTSYFFNIQVFAASCDTDKRYSVISSRGKSISLNLLSRQSCERVASQKIKPKHLGINVWHFSLWTQYSTSLLYLN